MPKRHFRRLEEIEIAGDLPEVSRLEEQLERLFAQPRAAAAARVEVMTIHKAKGLEFDTVIVPFAVSFITMTLRSEFARHSLSLTTGQKVLATPY